jgi:uncharacterized SAM-binding protein YcdF (DUF218 family)
VSRIRRHPLLSVIALVLLALVIVTGLSASTVWRAAHHDDASDVEHVDAIVVLGAAQYDGVPSPVFRERLDHAALLYRQGRAGRVVVLGANQPGDRTTEAEAGRDYLISIGLPADSVEAVPIGHTTWESLEAASIQVRSEGVHSVFLVSDPWHNARIKRMASDLGLEAYASATFSSAYASHRSRLGAYVRETFAYADYLVQGGR